MNQNTQLIGKPLDSLPTPALVVDEQAMEANLKLMGDYFAGRKCKLRPHFKGHKCVELARRQLQAGGAVGMTAAKLAEAEFLVAGGVDNVLIANQVIGAEKAARLARMNKSATVRCAVDDRDNIVELARQAQQAGVTVGVLVEVDVGMKRCGVPAGEPAVEMAQYILSCKGVRFDGLQGYEGHAVLMSDAQARREKVIQSLKPLVDTRRQLESAGIPCLIISSGGTGTYDITGNIDGIDEVQAGSYALMDGCYLKLRSEFVLARTVLVTVVSAHEGRSIVDVGAKGLGCEFGPPTVMGHPQVSVGFVAEEHTAIDGLEARVGQRLQLIPSHGCTTNNLYRRMWIAREGIIRDCWAIEASGALE